jgi:hypothetical protein
MKDWSLVFNHCSSRAQDPPLTMFVDGIIGYVILRLPAPANCCGGELADRSMQRGLVRILIYTWRP